MMEIINNKIYKWILNDTQWINYYVVETLFIDCNSMIHCNNDDYGVYSITYNMYNKFI